MNASSGREPSPEHLATDEDAVEAAAIADAELKRLRFRVASLEWQLGRAGVGACTPIGNAEALAGARPDERVTTDAELRLAAIEASTSWRVTAPLRAASRMLARLRGR